MPRISIIILNWNGYKDTCELLDSLKKIISPAFNILVVDNNSIGNDVEKLVNRYGSLINTIKAENNLGFAGGNNLGIKKALKDSTDYIVLINNDTIVELNFLESMLRVFDENQKVGIAAPQINYFSESNKIWSVGGRISRIKGSGFAYSDKIENESINESGYRDFVSGCCMMIKKEVFETIGLFDEKFFLYVEDTDFCYRTIKAGFKIFVSTQSKVYHKIGSSTGGKLEQLPIYYVTRNRLYFAKKNFYSTYLITVIYVFFTMILKSLWWNLTGKGNLVNSIKWAFKDFFRGIMGKADLEKFSVK